MRLRLGTAVLLAIGACLPALPAMAQDSVVTAPQPATPDDTRGPPVLIPPRLSDLPPGTRPTVVTNPRWARPPRPHYPDLAQTNNVEYGQVVLFCIVQPTGRISDCEVLEETPAGQGFGEEALLAAREASLTPRTVDGAALGARIYVPFTFRLPPPLPPAEPADPH